MGGSQIPCGTCGSSPPEICVPFSNASLRDSNSCQYVYFCTSKARKLSTCMRQPEEWSPSPTYRWSIRAVCCRMLPNADEIEYLHAAARGMVAFEQPPTCAPRLHTGRASVTYADTCWHMLAYAGVCWRMLAYAGALAYVQYCAAVIFYRKRARVTYADECWCMLTNTDRC